MAGMAAGFALGVAFSCAVATSLALWLAHVARNEPLNDDETLWS